MTGIPSWEGRGPSGPRGGLCATEDPRRRSAPPLLGKGFFIGRNLMNAVDQALETELKKIKTGTSRPLNPCPRMEDD